MKKLSNVDEATKGDKILVKEMTEISKEGVLRKHCFEYVLEVKRNNKKTLGCIYLNGPYSGSGFNWVKGYNLTGVKNKEYYLIENDSEITEKNYAI